ncbi:MAG TPA: VOC family protein [Streptosporangiaceae bacterium]|nr:VOC family protein [Streptosporangiaceae bacterium]
MALARIGLTVLDCADPATLAAFWAALLGGETTQISDDLVLVKTGHGSLAAMRVPHYRPPTWPDGNVPKQMHLDLAVDDLDAAEAEAVRLGARRAETQPAPTRWRVMLDPAGHPFCLCDWGKPAQG